MDRRRGAAGALRTVHAVAAVTLCSALAVGAAAEAPDPAVTATAAIHSWAAARDAAARDHKLVLVEIGAAWCAPCKAFARATSEAGSLRDVLTAVVLWSVDAETEPEGRALAQKHAIQGLPTFLLLDGAGVVLDRWAGFTGRAEFELQLTGALQDPLPAAARAARFDAHPNAADALRLARFRAAEANIPAALRYYTHARELAPEDGHEFEALRVAATGFATGRAAAADVQATASAFLARPEHPAAEWIACAEWLQTVAQREKSPALAWPALRAVVTHATGALDSTLATRRDALLVQHALEIEKNPERAVVYKRRTLPAGFEHDPRAVNAFAWWCLKYAVNLPEAERLMRQAAREAPPGRDRAMMLDTVAEIRAARGDARDAAVFAEAARREFPENPYYAKQVARFRAPLAAKP